MSGTRMESGFTVVEMVVSLVVMSLLLVLFFQLYSTSESQRVGLLRRASANDIAMTNLKKIATKSTIPAGTTACSAGGGTIATNASGGSPTWSTAGMAAEPLTRTYLPAGTVQSLTVSYPYGCATAMPAKITSTVTYPSNGTETISRAIYIN